MPRAATYQDVWVRYIHFTWQHGDDWRTDIQSSVLHNLALKTALFILDDRSCVFIPLNELRHILAGVVCGENGAIPFNVNPHSKTVNENRVQMQVIRPQEKQSENRKMIEKLLDGL
jgi:hypothetical protein